MPVYRPGTTVSLASRTRHTLIVDSLCLEVAWPKDDPALESGELVFSGSGHEERLPTASGVDGGDGLVSFRFRGLRTGVKYQLVLESPGLERQTLFTGTLDERLGLVGTSEPSAPLIAVAPHTTEADLGDAVIEEGDFPSAAPSSLASRSILDEDWTA